MGTTDGRGATMARICNQVTTTTGGRCTHPVDNQGDHCAAGAPTRVRAARSAPMARRVRALRDDALFADETPAIVDVGRVTPEEAIEAIAGDPDDRSARRAVVQTYGTVGAWLVCGYEDAARRTATGGQPCAPLDRLVSGFPVLDVGQIASALDALDTACGAPDDAATRACHRMEAAYAVAARDRDPLARANYRSAWTRFRQTTRSAA
ncbi:MAG TPA: hypothetical protein VG014_05605 [Acidimicrobiales bacterium]|nr:hypothetical protein [Acidimicrobiales bacterium]